jgi:hypothetical protein
VETGGSATKISSKDSNINFYFHVLNCNIVSFFQA